jgi:hypothetical protein
MSRRSASWEREHGARWAASFTGPDVTHVEAE